MRKENVIKTNTSFRPSSPRRNVVRGIGAALTLYPAQKHCGMTEREYRRGFTLIELLVVVLIIGILAAVAVPQYQLAVDRSRLSEGISLIRTVAQAEQVFYMENNTYTDDFHDLDIGFDIAPTDSAQARANYCTLQIWRAISTNVVYAQHKQKLWYLYYDLSQEKLFCGSKDERGKTLCKSIGKGEELACGTDGSTPCWEIK